VKFHRGLDPTIQNRIALMLEGRPKDEAPSEWYNAARMVATTHAANEAFLAPKFMAPAAAPCKAAEAPPRLSTAPPVVQAPVSGPTPMEVDATKNWFARLLVCRRCGKVGHFA
jgi:hypothetical protein